MRLLLVTDAVGGVWTYSLELARSLEPHGIETVLAVAGPRPSEQQRREASRFTLIETDLPLDWLETSPSELRRAGDTLAAIASREGVDLVQTCSAALLADASFEQPCVAVQHSCVASWWAAVKGTPLPHAFDWRRELVECGLNRASMIVTPTAAFGAETSRVYDLCRPVLCVHNGRRPVAAVPGEHSDFVFTASRLWDEGKDAATLDAAAGKLQVPFVAAGPATGPNGAHASLDHLGLIGEVRPEKLASLLAARPIFASAAVYEPFGLSALEAAHAGCALVLADIATHRELWDGAALFVRARDPDAFADAIDRLLRDPAERMLLGEAARVRAQRYTPETMAARMADIYERVAERVELPSIQIEAAGALA